MSFIIQKRCKKSNQQQPESYIDEMKKGVIIMENRQWKYKVGGRAQGILPSLFLLALFGGVSIYLYLNKNGAFLFCMILTLIAFVSLIACIYWAIFVKVLIGEDGFYHQTKPGNGRYYKYSEITEAWQSEGKQLNGVTGYFCSYETNEGKSVEFPFFPFESDGIDYLIERVQEASVKTDPVDTDDEQKEYTIDGKTYGKTSIVIALVCLVLVAAMTVPLMLYTAPTGVGIIGFFFGTGILLVLPNAIRLVIRYFCFKVRIGNTGFYFQSNPFNGKHYPYSDIKSCRIEKKVYHQPGDSLYYYYFIFTDKNGKTTKVQFQKPISGHEIDVLMERIEQANGLSREA